MDINISHGWMPIFQDTPEAEKVREHMRNMPPPIGPMNNPSPEKRESFLRAVEKYKLAIEKAGPGKCIYV